MVQLDAAGGGGFAWDGLRTGHFMTISCRACVCGCFVGQPAVFQTFYVNMDAFRDLPKLTRVSAVVYVKELAS